MTFWGHRLTLNVLGKRYQEHVISLANMTFHSWCCGAPCGIAESKQGKMVSSSLQAPVMSLSLDRFAVFICSLPLLSFASCVAIAIALHFEETTWSHCKVSVFLNNLLREIITFLCSVFPRYILRISALVFRLNLECSSFTCQPSEIISLIYEHAWIHKIELTSYSNISNGIN